MNMKKIFIIITTLILFGSLMVKAVTYTPAGEPASVFDETWNPGLETNDMRLSNGLYVFAKKDNFASQTAISFKVCKDHAWTTAYPGSNYGFNIPAGSQYLIITYNTSGNAVNAMAISSMTVAGDNSTLFGSTWAPTATANDMTLQSDGTYKFEKSGVALSAGSVTFKACANHAWTNAWPGDNYSLTIPESGNYTITITFNPATLTVSATAELEEAVVVIPTIQLHSNITNPSWAASDNFALAGNEETASLTLTGVSKGSYEFGVKIDGTWTSNGSAFTRDDNSHAVVAGSGNCTFNADRNGDYTFTWTYATNTLEIGYPAIPAQSVTFNSLASQILKSSVINLANCVTSSGIDNPTYRFYIKEKNGSYGDAINANYNFNTNGEYVVKVEALEYNTGEPVASDESAVVVYQSYTFTNGSTIYVDFSAVDGDAKGVNYPKVDQVGMDYDAAGAGTIKAVTFTTNVTWTTMEASFIKTEKNGWAAQPFTVPGIGKNCVKVAADGASYTWDTYVDLTTEFYLVGSLVGWGSTDYRFMKATGDATEASTTVNITEYSNITFKLKENGEWRSCEGTVTLDKDHNTVTIANENGNNIGMIPYAAGDYIFTLNLSTRELTVTYPDGEAMPIPTNIYLSSDELNNWAAADPNYKFSVSGDVATLEVALEEEATYSFKLVYNDAWLGANYDFKYYWCTDVPLIVDGDEAKVYSFKAGTYTFRYTLSTGELSIAYPATSSTDVTISQYEYATLYSATAFDVPEEVEAYVISGIEGIKLTMDRIYRIPANTGVLLHAPQGNYSFYEGDGRWMDAPASNLLKGSTVDQEIDNELVHFVLSYDTENQVGFYWPYGTGTAQGVGSFENKAGKAYVEIPAESQSAGVIARRGFPFRPIPEVATALGEIESETGAQKFILNGQLLIIRDGMLFNAQGVRVQ